MPVIVSAHETTDAHTLGRRYAILLDSILGVVAVDQLFDLGGGDRIERVTGLLYE